MAKYPTRKRIFDLAGEGQINPDGTKRQAILRYCRPGQAVTLLREPDNHYDRNAVRIATDAGTIGYLARADAFAIAPELDNGRSYSACIHELTGGMPDYPNFGCRICITWEGQKLMSPQDIRPEQSLYGQPPTRAGCGVFALMIAAPVTAMAVSAFWRV